MGRVADAGPLLAYLTHALAAPGQQYFVSCVFKCALSCSLKLRAPGRNQYRVLLICQGMISKGICCGDCDTQTSSPQYAFCINRDPKFPVTMGHPLSEQTVRKELWSRLSLGLARDNQGYMGENYAYFAAKEENPAYRHNA
jgi:hypothetical protein